MGDIRMMTSRAGPAEQVGFRDLFEAEPRPVATPAVESVEEFRALLLALQEGADRGGSRAGRSGTRARPQGAGARGTRARPRGQPELVHAESLPARPAKYGDLAEPLPRVLAHVLDSQGISRLYSHQAEAIDLARAGKHVVVATGTASGKSLAQDQLRGLRRFADASHDLARVLATGT